jgi:hypothetical protein
MKYRNIFWGVILILIGILFTLENLNLIYFNIRELWRLWPVVLILWGISILPADKWIRLGLVLLVLAGSVFFMLDQTVEWENDRMDNVEWPEIGNNTYHQDFDITNEDSAEFVTLNLDASAGSFRLNDTSVSLLHFSQNSSGIQYKYFVKKTDERVKINIEPSNSHIRLNKKSESKVKINLNTAPLWNINLDAGAAAIKFDLSSFKIRKLNVEVGAASVKLKLGDLYPETKVNIEAGASEIVLEIPKESGCDMEASALFSGKTIKGFDKIDHGHYQTPNFNTAANKIYVEMNAAVSSYTIIRY